MSNFVSLDDAAKRLGVSADEIVEMRSRGDIFGYRDGASWKFKPEEIERVASELMGDALDEDPAGSSILVSEGELGSSSSHGSTIGSDIQSADEDSDVQLVADPNSGSDVRLVSKGDEGSELQLADDDDLQLASSDDDDDELSLAADDGDDLLAAASGASSGLGSDLELAGSDLGLGSAIGGDSDALELAGDDASNVIGSSDLNLEGGSELIKGDSDPNIDSGSLDLGSDLEISDDEGDLVLGGGSDLALGSDSGINLMSPADSGISLEEPLDLSASGISGLDLAAEGSDVESPSASGSAVDFQQDEEFNLSPSGALETDDDSGSQVIELEDSSEFGDAPVAVADGFDDVSAVDSAGAFGDDTEGFGETAPAAAIPAAPQVHYNLMEVLLLLGTLLVMCMGGILVSDVVRNMWSWAGSDSSLTSGFTDMILSATGSK
ncbi:MAG: hypothetical protein Aurels2KO_16910 [Aureliella sp.]